MELLYDNDHMTTLLKGIIGDRRLLILENDSTLSDSIEHFYLWCVENKIQVNILYRVSELPIEYIKEEINWADMIAYMSTYTYEIVDNLIALVKSFKDPKRIIECYIDKPGFRCLPKDAKQHQMWALHSFHPVLSEWKLDKLTQHINPRLF